MTSTVLAKEFDGKLWVLADYLQQAINDACMRAVLEEREACAKVCDAYGMPDGTSETARVLAVCIRARTLHELNRAAQQNGEEL